MSYYLGQQGSAAQYPKGKEYSAPCTLHDPAYPQWDQQQESRQLSGLEQPQKNHQPLSLPPPPPPPFYQNDVSVPSQIPMQGTHDSTPIRLLLFPKQPQVRWRPLEINPVMVQMDTTARYTVHAALRPHSQQYHPYQHTASASGISSEAH
ncbi:hypothetical protein B0H10DRAFT_2240502 [Mycena sp. CBHHK59/15]|nr:hypothetical protein B0H10DRAFT_2240502 [Mycena sp. CBHHK59/15]